jgi:hypothetical protein
VPDDELDEVSAHVRAPDGVRLLYITESECLGDDYSIVRKLDWWRRQQAIKLLATIRLEFSSTIVFNSDVVCIAEFNESSFILNEKLISDWEPKDGQSWWNATARLLAVDTANFGSYGLSVVPNVISCDLARSSHQFFRKNYGNLPTLLLHAGRLLPDEPVSWTDFSLYTLLAEMTNKLFSYHVAPEQTFGLPYRVRSENSVWQTEEFAGKVALIDRRRPDGIFVCIQSALKISPEIIREHLIDVV